MKCNNVYITIISIQLLSTLKIPHRESPLAEAPYTEYTSKETSHTLHTPIENFHI